MSLPSLPLILAKYGLNPNSPRFALEKLPPGTLLQILTQAITADLPLACGFLATYPGGLRNRDLIRLPEDAQLRGQVLRLIGSSAFAPIVSGMCGGVEVFPLSSHVIGVASLTGGGCVLDTPDILLPMAWEVLKSPSLREGACFDDELIRAMQDNNPNALWAWLCKHLGEYPQYLHDLLPHHGHGKPTVLECREVHGRPYGGIVWGDFPPGHPLHKQWEMVAHSAPLQAAMQTGALHGGCLYHLNCHSPGVEKPGTGKTRKPGTELLSAQILSQGASADPLAVQHC